MPPYNRSMNNEPNALAPRLDSFLTELLDHIDCGVIETINPRDAHEILNLLPEGNFRAALRDAFRDNIIDF